MLASQVLGTIFVVWAGAEFLGRVWSKFIEDRGWSQTVEPPLFETAAAGVFAVFVLNGIWGWFL